MGKGKARAVVKDKARAAVKGKARAVVKDKGQGGGQGQGQGRWSRDKVRAVAKVVVRAVAKVVVRAVVKVAGVVRDKARGQGSGQGGPSGPPNLSPLLTTPPPLAPAGSISVSLKRALDVIQALFWWAKPVKILRKTKKQISSETGGCNERACQSSESSHTFAKRTWKTAAYSCS